MTVTKLEQFQKSFVLDYDTKFSFCSSYYRRASKILCKVNAAAKFLSMGNSKQTYLVLEQIIQLFQDLLDLFSPQRGMTNSPYADTMTKTMVTLKAATKSGKSLANFENM